MSGLRRITLSITPPAFLGRRFLASLNADGKGALITASRSVIYAFDPADPNWPQSITQAARSFANQIASAI